MSMITQDATNRDEALVELVVRNTFLSVDAARRAEPRSASVPASLRLAGVANGGKPSAVFPAVTAGARSKEASPRSEHSSYWGDSSTEEGCSVTAEVLTEADASEGGDALSSDLEQALADRAPWKTGEILAQMFANPRALDEMLAHEEDFLATGSQPAAPLPGAAPAPAPPAPTSHIRLSAKAKAWVPTSSSAPGAPRPPEIQCQLLALLSVVKAVLAGTDCVEGVEATESSLGWCVAAQILGKDIHRKENVLGLAKEALLQAALETRSIYVLGYRWRPFVATPLGFSAILGGVRDPDQACWGMLKSGTCRDGGCCRWEHPICKVTLHIMVKVVEAPPPSPTPPAQEASGDEEAASQAGLSAGSAPGKTRLALSVLCA